MTKLKTPEARKLSALAEIDPKKFRTTIHDAIVAAGGDVSAAARALGLSPRQFWRWIGQHPSVLEGTDHRRNPSIRKGKIVRQKKKVAKRKPKKTAKRSKRSKRAKT